MTRGRVLVVDAGAEYVDHLARHCPGRALFVTDRAIRGKATLPAPPAPDEVLVPAGDEGAVLDGVAAHLAAHGLEASGVACYDDESMRLASLLAARFGLPYPPPRAAAACRSKLASKELWRAAGLACPAAAPVGRAEDAVAFLAGLGGRKLVLKPLTGAGSELVSFCATAEECAAAVALALRRLGEMGDARMYAPLELGGRTVDPRRLLVAEELVQGTEHSCDFVVDGDAVEVVRVARKWLDPGPTPGLALAYEVPAAVPVARAVLEDVLRRAARAVGIERALCMLDFIVDRGELVLLEIAARPGGDCLPPLLRASAGLDPLALALDVAEGRPLAVPPAGAFRHLVGLRLFAPRAGTVAALDPGRLAADPRVVEVHLGKGPGHRVRKPPEDYDSHVLGHVLFAPSGEAGVGDQCVELHGLLGVAYAEEGP